MAGSQSVVRKDGQYYLKVYDGKLQAWLWSGASTKVTITTAAAVMTAGAWQHVAVTYDGTTTRIYRNGAQVASQATSVTIPSTANALHWGDSVIGGVEQNFLTGALDDVAVYNQALTAGQVSGHYQAGLPAPHVTGRARDPDRRRRAGPDRSELGRQRGSDELQRLPLPDDDLPRDALPLGHHGHELHRHRPAREHDLQLPGDRGERRRREPSQQHGHRHHPGGAHGLRAPDLELQHSGGLELRAGRVLAARGVLRDDRVRHPRSGRLLRPAWSLGAGGAIAGDADTAAMFNGSSFVSVPSATALNSTRLSLEAWVRPSSSVAGSQTIVRKEGQYQLKIYDGQAPGLAVVGRHRESRRSPPPRP